MHKVSDPIVGIDLGTTNSLVAYVQDGKPAVLESREGKHLLPSVISFLEQGSPVIGYRAKLHKIRDAEKTVFSVKRLLGRGVEDLKSAALPYAIEKGEGGLRVRVGTDSYTPIEISAMILRELKLSAEKALGTTVTKAVITVPAYFNDSQRQATRTAGRLAGFDVLRVLNEPTAASLAYGLDRKREGLIAVYDLGGGTFDISILKLHDGIFEVLATNGNTTLGGDDLDQVLARAAASEIKTKFGLDAGKDLNLWALLLETAEKVKIALSKNESATFEVVTSNGTYKKVWTRGEFEKQVWPILELTRTPCVQALKDAGISNSELSDVVLVGGPTRLGVVQKMAKEIFGRDPNTSVHPDEVVALGAAIQADILAGNNRELLLLDVVPLSLGIETYGGLMSTLIPRNTRIPTVARETFTTFVDKQTAVDIHVLQGERERAEENRSLSRFKLKGIEPAHAGFPRVEVTFLIDADGILQVSAKDLKTGNEQSIEVKPSYGLTDAEVEKMLSEGFSHSEEDSKFRERIEAKNEVEPILRAAEKKLPDAFRLLTEDDAQQIQKKMEHLRNVLGQSNPPADAQTIREAGRQLDRVSVKLADLLLKEALR